MTAVESFADKVTGDCCGSTLSGS